MFLLWVCLTCYVITTFLLKSNYYEWKNIKYYEPKVFGSNYKILARLNIDIDWSR